MNALHRNLLSCALVGCVSAHAAPFLAIGDNAELFLTATTGVRYEDNTLLTENNTVDDVILEFVPGIELIFGKDALLSGSFVVQEKFTHYVDTDRINSNLESYFFKSKYNNAKLSVSANASYRELQQNSRDILNAATLTRRDALDAGINGELVMTEKTKIGAGISYGKTDYKTAGFNDSSSITVPVNFYYAIRPKIDLSLGVRHRETKIEGVANSDYSDTYYNVGARGEFTSKLSGRFSVGVTDRDSEAGNDSTMLGLDFDLYYALSPKTSLSLVLSNDFDASSTGGTSQEVLSVTFGGSTQFNANLSGNASVRYQQADYSNGRQDDFMVFSVSSSYAFNQHISGVLAYSFQDNDSNTPGASFTANVISLSAVFRY